MNSRAFIDGQNLYLGTTLSDDPWKIDLYKFRHYLRRKYNIDKAYYFIGCYDVNQQDLYSMIQDAGYILAFRAHNEDSTSSKKGNVDTDIVSDIMRTFHEHPEVDKFYLISGDGDYYKTIKYLHDNNKLGKVLFPAHRIASSLYHQLDEVYYDYLDCLDYPDIRKEIELV